MLSLYLMKNLLLLLTITICFTGYGQQAYSPGYIVTIEGDTLNGLVSDRKPPPFGEIYDKIRFKDEKGKKKRFRPSQITSYKAGDNLFESVWVKRINMGLNIFDERYFFDDRTGEKVFLRVAKKGELSVYRWDFQEQGEDFIGSAPFFKRKSDDFMVRAAQGLFGLKKKVLTEYFSDCPSLQSKIQADEFKYPESVADYYNSVCMN